MHQRRIQAAADQPYNIAEEVQATSTVRAAYNFFTKRPQHQLHHFKTLQSPGYTHHGNAQQHPAKKIAERSKEAAKDEPENIADEVFVIHLIRVLYNAMKIQ